MTSKAESPEITMSQLLIQDPTALQNIFDTTGERINIYPRVGNCSDSNCRQCPQQSMNPETQLFQATCAYNEPEVPLADAQTIISGYVTSISADLEYLRGAVSCHGNTIVSRWKKKSRQNRREYLLQAHPSMYEAPMFLAWVTHHLSGKMKAEGLSFHDSFLLPFFSVESLQADPNKLFALLHARTAFDPTDWVLFDRNQTQTPWSEGHIAFHYSNCFVDFSTSNYGEIVECDVAKAHRWDICAFPRAKLIFEAQCLLLGFLRRLVQHLLEGTQGESGDLKWVQLKDTGFRGGMGCESWSGYTNKAYSSPLMSFDRLVDIASSKFDEASDKLWLLQTDPAYLLQVLKTEHQGIGWKGPNKEIMDLEKIQVLPFDLWARPVGDVRMWRGVTEELNHVKAMYERYRDSIHIGQPLPPKFDSAMECLELLLLQHALQRQEQLALLLPFLEAFEKYFVFHQCLDRELDDYGQTKITMHPDFVPTSEQAYNKDPLFWCIWRLTGDAHECIVIDPDIFFGFLEYWLGKDTTTIAEKSRIEPRLLEELSSIAALYELMGAVSMFRPCHSSKKTFEKAAALSSSRAAWRCTEPMKNELYPIKFHKRLSRQHKSLNYSVFPTGNRDATWLKSADGVRQMSNDYWKIAHDMHRCYLNENHAETRMYTDEDKERELDDFLFANSPEHLTALEAEREAILNPKPRHNGKKEEKYRGPGWDHESKNDKNISTALANKSKLKPKTRPEDSSPTTAEIEQDLSAIALASPPSQRTLIPVKPETLRVLLRLYPTTAADYSAKPLDWRAFVVAMEDVGFFATQSSGSAVAFIKEGKGRIVLHRPHPVAKIEQIWLQSWGKRMNKWFGWERDSFVSVKK